MTKVTMPDPQLIVDFCENADLHVWEAGNERSAGVVRNASRGEYITTDQAEAYASAKVMEALERAESQIMKMHDQAVKARVHPDQAEDGWNDSCADRAIALGEAVLAIRALIPPLPGPVEPQSTTAQNQQSAQSA